MTERVTIYSDGGADPNPGIGGWAAILRLGEHEKVLTGSEVDTTNNRMELQAAIAALEALKRPSAVDFYTDSQYVRRGITEWIEGWAERGWAHKSGRPISNIDLWQQLWSLVKTHEIDWHWVKGHAGDELNERVDQLARAARLAITPETILNDDIPRLFVRASCKGNPGPGGWGAVLEEGEETTQLSGFEPSTTNNRMELMAVIAGLELVPERDVEIHTVSDYLFQGATRWLPGWRQRGWKKRGGQPVANGDLWRQIDAALKAYHIRWVNAKGQEAPGLDEAARLAVNAIESPA